MTGKHEEIHKNARCYWQSSGWKNKEAQKIFELTKVGEDVDPSVEDSKVRRQMMLRIRTNT